MDRSSAWRRITLVVGLPFLVLALFYAYRDISQLTVPPVGRWLMALPLTTAFLVGAQRSYSVLLPSGGSAAHRLNFYESQLVKYSPLGGMAQTASQTLSVDDGSATRGEMFRAVLLSKLTAVAGGVLWGPVLAVAGDFSPLVSVGLCALGAGVLVVHPGVLGAVFRLAGKVRPSFDVSAEIPPASLVARSVLFGAIALGCAGLGFAALLRAEQGGVSATVTAVAGFAIAWAAAFVVIPLPGGIGLREVVLGALVVLPSGAILVAALGLRIVQMISELLLIGYSRLRNAEPDPESTRARPEVHSA